MSDNDPFRKKRWRFDLDMRNFTLILVGILIAALAFSMLGGTMDFSRVASISQLVPAKVRLTVNQRELFDEMNAVRNDNGFSDLILDSRLCEAAQARAPYYSHKAMGENPAETARNYGYYPKRYAENIAQGQSTGTEVVADWWDDKGIPGKGHRRNMLGPYTYVGVGKSGDNWVAIFAD